MTFELAGRLAVLLACAASLGVLYVRLAGRAPTPREPGAPRPLGGSVEAALGAFVVVAGGAAVTGIGVGQAEGDGLALVRAGGIVVLAAAGVLAAGRGPSRSRIGAPGIVGLAWLGAGLALASPLVLLVAAAAIVLLAVRVTERPAG
jgi:hypothetical protein